MPVKLPTRWPARQALIEWGLKPCPTPGCRVLVNVEVTGVPHCVECRSRHRNRKGRRR